MTFTDTEHFHSESLAFFDTVLSAEGRAPGGGPINQPSREFVSEGQCWWGTLQYFTDRDSGHLESGVTSPLYFKMTVEPAKRIRTREARRVALMKLTRAELISKAVKMGALGVLAHTSTYTKAQVVTLILKKEKM